MSKASELLKSIEEAQLSGGDFRKMKGMSDAIERFVEQIKDFRDDETDIKDMAVSAGLMKKQVEQILKMLEKKFKV